jgi:hypothetical protein
METGGGKLDSPLLPPFHTTSAFDPEPTGDSSQLKPGDFPDTKRPAITGEAKSQAMSRRTGRAMGLYILVSLVMMIYSE